MTALRTDLVSVVDIGVRQGPWHQLKQHDPIAVHIRLKRVGVGVLHSDHFWCLSFKQQKAGKYYNLFQNVALIMTSVCLKLLNRLNHDSWYPISDNRNGEGKSRVSNFNHWSLPLLLYRDFLFPFVSIYLLLFWTLLCQRIRMKIEAEFTWMLCWNVLSYAQSISVGSFIVLFKDILAWD